MELSTLTFFLYFGKQLFEFKITKNSAPKKNLIFQEWNFPAPKKLNQTILKFLAPKNLIKLP